MLQTSYIKTGVRQCSKGFRLALFFLWEPSKPLYLAILLGSRREIKTPCKAEHFLGRPYPLEEVLLQTVGGSGTLCSVDKGG